MILIETHEEEKKQKEMVVNEKSKGNAIKVGKKDVPSMDQ
jgi:hypothetical protein